MSIEGRVREALRRELSASRPLVIDGEHDLDGCWALDRAFGGGDVPTAVQQVLDEVRLRPAQRATVAVAARMAEHLQRYRWPADLVVVPVPSADPVVDLLARAVAFHLEVPCRSLLKLRAGTAGAPVERRIAARARAVPAHVLMIGDRLQSGRTLRTCGWVLRERGAQAVWAMVAAADVRTEVSADGDATAASGGTRLHQRGDLDDVWNELVGAELELPVLEPSSADDGDTDGAVGSDADAVEDAPAEAPAEEAPADDHDLADHELDDRDEIDDEDAPDDEIPSDDAVDASATSAVEESAVSPERAHRRSPKRRNRRAHRR